MKHISETEKFSIVKRAKSFSYALAGIRVMFKTQHNAWLHSAIGIVLVVLGMYFRISSIEWIVIVASVGLLLALECVNTAIEIDIDLTSPDFHPYARDTKDAAAGAVLLWAITSAVIWLIIFIPYFARQFLPVTHWIPA